MSLRASMLGPCGVNRRETRSQICCGLAMAEAARIVYGRSCKGRDMARTPEQFEDAMLDLLQEIRYGRPSYLDEFNKHHLCREGAWVYALEHCVFGAHFPRWLANVTGRCPELEVRKYL